MEQLNESTFKHLMALTELQSISGHESSVRQYMQEAMSAYVDECEVSGLGNLFGIKRAKQADAPTVMLAGHMDEVGFMLSRIEDNGTFRAVPIGGWNVYAVPAQRFTLQTQQGDIPVISSAVPPHLMKQNASKPIQVKDIYFDAGFESKEEAEGYGVRPGDPIVPEASTVVSANGKSLISKAIDNRYGCALVLDVLEALKDVDLPFHLVAGATVQEEVGLRGVKGAVHRYAPDIFFAVDASPAGDGEGDKTAQGQLGQGFLLRVQDPGHISHPPLWHYIQAQAENAGIPYQYYFSQGGTDAGAAHVMNDGVPSAVIGLPARYIHGHQSLMRLRDYEAARDIVLQVFENLQPEIIQEIKG